MELKIKTYLPHSTKAGIIEAIVDMSCVEQDGIIIYDNMKRELYFNVILAKEYAGLEFEENEQGQWVNIEEQYDKIAEDGTMDLIIDGIGKDYFLLLESLDVAIENKLKQNTVEAILSKGIKSLIDMLDKRLDSKNLSKIVKQLEKLDFDKAKTVLEVVKNK